ncbi:MAG: hypothetical protein GF398_06995 [Chitinivibrionales bacterium]|nr:hypothetical protein [Chitinivibrionales bacterium]
MIKKLFATGLIAFTALAVVSFNACEDDDPPNGPSGCDSLMFTKPDSAATYKVGDTLALEWCHQEPYPYSQILIKYTTDGGGTWADVGSEALDDWYPFTPNDKNFELVLTADHVGELVFEIKDYDGNQVSYSLAVVTVEP